MEEFRSYQHLFDKIEQKTSAKQEDLFKLADSVRDANFNDEHTVRNLVKEISSIADVPVSADNENSIVEAIVKESISSDSNKF